MTAPEYLAAIHKLGLTTAAAAPVLGLKRRQSFRFASGESPVTETVAKLLKALLTLRKDRPEA